MINNYVLYGIIIYVTIIAMLIIIKPDFLYDHVNSKFKEFGNKKNNTIFTIGIVSILLAVAIGIIFSLFQNKEPVLDIDKKQNQPQINYQYVPIPMYSQIPNIVYQMPQSHPKID